MTEGWRRGRGIVLAMLAAAMLVIAACGALQSSAATKIGSPPYLRGSGTQASESRPLQPFKEIAAAQGVAVVLAHGEPSATVTADDNLVGHITTSVANGVLTVDVAGSIETDHPLKVVVAAPAPLQRLAASTGASIDAEGMTGDKLAVEANTGATVRAGGQVDAIRVTSVAGGTADVRNLTARTASVEVTSGATAHVRATESVSGSCTLGSTLRVHGGGSTAGVTVDGTSSLGRD